MKSETEMNHMTCTTKARRHKGKTGLNHKLYTTKDTEDTKKIVQYVKWEQGVDVGFYSRSLASIRGSKGFD